jgi:hypothetical protein
MIYDIAVHLMGSHVSPESKLAVQVRVRGIKCQEMKSLNRVLHLTSVD